MEEGFKKLVQRFVKMDNIALGELYNLFKPNTVKKKTLLYAEGQHSNKLSILLDGHLRGYIVDKDGDEITTNFYFAPTVLADYESFSTKQPSNLNIHALVDCELLECNFTDLEKLANSNLQVCIFVRELLGHLFRFQLNRQTSFILKNNEERYLDLLKERPKVIQNMPQHYIASYLGIKPQSLSRIRQRLLSMK